MSTQTAEFDPKRFLEERNSADALKREGKEVPGKPASVEAKTEVKPEVHDEEDGEHGPSPRASRSQRRRENQLLREVGELTGRLSVLEQLLTKNGQSAENRAVKEENTDPEPQRENFQTDAAYNRALGRWDARQEATKAVETVKTEQKQSEEQRQYNETVTTMAAKCAEDIKEIADWDEWQKKSADDENQPEFKLDEHPILASLLATSDQQARILRFWAEHPKSIQRMLELTPNSGLQIREFAQLEGRVENLYKKAAQASEEDPKDRTHPAEAAPKGEAGRPAVAEVSHKPRPTTEVTAKGGSPAPSEPPIGSKEWMAMRNRAQYGR